MWKVLTFGFLTTLRTVVDQIWSKLASVHPAASCLAHLIHARGIGPMVHIATVAINISLWLEGTLVLYLKRLLSGETSVIFLY